MKRISRNFLIWVIVSFVPVMGALIVGTAGLGHATTPISIKGVFLPVQGQSSTPLLRTYILKMGSQEIAFFVKNIALLLRPGATDSEIMNYVTSHKIELVGNERIKALLNNPAIIGQTVQLNGVFYRSIGRMYVGSVRTIPETNRRVVD